MRGRYEQTLDHVIDFRLTYVSEAVKVECDRVLQPLLETATHLQMRTVGKLGHQATKLKS